MITVLAAALAGPTGAQAQVDDATTLRAEAFEAAQSAITSAAAAALTKVAAAFARGGDKVAGLERRRASLTREREEAEARYAELLGDDTPGRVAGRAAVAREVEALHAQARAIEADILQLNPAYYELTRPRPLDVTRTQALLNADEGLLLLLPGDDATYLFAITAERLTWARSSALPEAVLAGKVATLRAGLQADVDPGTGLLGNGPTTFDPVLAHELYRGLVAPVEDVLRGKRVVMTVAGGTLGALPLQLLVTALPGRDAAKVATRYLIDQYALTALPAVSSLQALRCLLVAPERRHSGCGSATASAARPRRDGSIQLVGVGAPTLAGAPVPVGSRAMPAGFSIAFKGGLADTGRLRELPYLPGSRAELEALGERFGAARSELRLGDAATEREVRTSATLRSAKYVVLSTHGLLAGEGGVEGEPGLVFTPPAEEAKSSDDDGLLTASEAAQLDLAADMVILSACNTAAPDGRSGGEGLSGLARAFLFAGARALMVSHWQVSDTATSALMTKTLAAIESGEARDRAEAVRAAMRAVRADPSLASPGFWAAFTLVGVPE